MWTSVFTFSFSFNQFWIRISLTVIFLLLHNSVLGMLGLYNLCMYFHTFEQSFMNLRSIKLRDLENILSLMWCYHVNRSWGILNVSACVLNLQDGATESTNNTTQNSQFLCLFLYYLCFYYKCQKIYMCQYETHLLPSIA